MHKAMATQQEDSEKRNFVRYELRVHGQITCGDGSQYEGFVRDISMGGLFLEIPNLDAKYANTTVIVKIQATVKHSIFAVESACTLVRVTPDGVGLYIDQMAPVDKKVFFSIIQEIRGFSGG